MSDIPKISIVELRSNLADYLKGKEPIAIVRYGQTIGYYVPAIVDEEAEKESLKKAVCKLDGLLEEGV